MNANHVVTQYLTMNFPIRYKLRNFQSEIIKKDWFFELPMFVFGDIMCPTQTLCLHLFEQRYKKMISRCLNEDHKFIFYPMVDKNKIELNDFVTIM